MTLWKDTENDTERFKTRYECEDWDRRGKRGASTAFPRYGHDSRGKGDGRKVLQESGGTLLADENAESIKNAIVALANMDKKERARLGALNKMYYDSHFSTEIVTREIESHLKK